MVRWKVKAESLTLDAYVGRDKSVWYSIGLLDCCSSAEVLDWIAQLSHKSWMTDTDLGSLVRGLDALLGLQTRYCSGGTGKRVSAAKVRELIQAWDGKYLDEIRPQ